MINNSIQSHSCLRNSPTNNSKSFNTNSTCETLGDICVGDRGGRLKLETSAWLISKKKELKTQSSSKGRELAHVMVQTSRRGFLGMFLKQ